MPAPYVYYDRENLNSTEVQFFINSRAEAANKERDTNLPKKYQVDKDFHLTRIIVQTPMQLVSSTTAKDATLDDNARILLEEAAIDLQIGEGPHYYFPVALALGGPEVNVSLAYTLGTAADGSYGVLAINGGNGLPVDIKIPADTDIHFYIRTNSTPAINPVTVFLVGEH